MLINSYSYFATEQASFCASSKATLKMGEFLVTADFSVSFCKMLTRIPLGITPTPPNAYYLDLREIYIFVSYVISDCLLHDSVIFHLFQRSFIAFLKELPQAILHHKKLNYFSDGAALQYKIMKNFLNCVTT